MGLKVAVVGATGNVGREMLAILDTVIPQPQPPEDITRGNPEEAEAPAQRLVGIIEEVVDANLYAGREPGTLAARLAEETNGTLALCGLSGEVQRLFDLGAFTDLFVIYSSREEGVTRLS